MHWWEYLLQYFQDRKYCKYHDLASCGICSICSRPALINATHGRVSLNAISASTRGVGESLQVRRPLALGHCCRLSLTRAAALCPRCLRSTPSASLAPSAPRRARAGMDPTIALKHCATMSMTKVATPRATAGANALTPAFLRGACPCELASPNPSRAKPGVLTSACGCAALAG